MAPVISAIILAAGEAKRMGKPKLLLPLGEGTIVEQTIDNFLNSNVNEIIVVVGNRAEEIINIIANKPVTVAVNPDYPHGMSTSIVAGLTLICDKTQAVMIALADQPFIDAQVIDCLIEAFGDHNKGIVIPVCRGRRGHPVIFDIKYRDDLLSLKGDIGGREIISRYPDDILEIPINHEGIHLDIDTLDHYSLEKAKLKDPRQ